LGTDAAASTTDPASSTGRDRRVSLVNQIRWVFPSPLVTRVASGHVVGRDESCDTVLPGTEISRRHAEFWVDGPVVAIRDLDSRNGVVVNASKRADAPLVSGDVIRCGEWIGIAVVAGDEAAEFRQISPGWYGGSLLAAAIEPARQFSSDLAVIVQGETGTGKEGVARTIHGWRDRRGPFVAVNCAALPTHLAEAELFGHRKGAFTGADRANPGLFRAAHGGTIFLDEILELPLAIQPKLLRVLEQREVHPLGETTPIPIDVQVVAATQEPLAGAVADKRFRADLYARLDGLTVVLPPLRMRREDIAPLFMHFVREHAGGRPPGLEPKLVEALCLYDWPLNVRELLLVARRLLGVHGHEGLLRKTHLPQRVLSRASEDSRTKADASEPARRVWRKTDDEAEFESLLVALRAQGGSVARAAAALGVSRARAYRLLAAHPDFSLDEIRK
jgi:transcriptional regulator of acetoin/glycerol metabolism